MRLLLDSFLRIYSRITLQEVKAEIQRLRLKWQGKSHSGHSGILTSVLEPGQEHQLDLFDKVQLAEVIRICQKATTISEAGRIIFNISRRKKKHTNDSDRLRKYLAKYGLDWKKLQVN